MKKDAIIRCSHNKSHNIKYLEMMIMREGHREHLIHNDAWFANDITNDILLPVNYPDYNDYYYYYDHYNGIWRTYDYPMESLRAVLQIQNYIRSGIKNMRLKREMIKQVKISLEQDLSDLPVSIINEFLNIKTDIYRETRAKLSNHIFQKYFSFPVGVNYALLT